ncbi:MAG: DUF302 domain-containing protein [Rhizobiaceae bacterium]
MNSTSKNLLSGMTVAAALAISSSAFAEIVRVESNLEVAESISRISDAVENGGNTVFSIVDFTRGASSVGMELRPTAAIIFGSPKIGAGAFKVSQDVGLFVPLKVLAYKDEAGKVWLAYEEPQVKADKFGIPTDHPAIVKMSGALSKMATIGSGR